MKKAQELQAFVGCWPGFTCGNLDCCSKPFSIPTDLEEPTGQRQSTIQTTLLCAPFQESRIPTRVSSGAHWGSGMCECTGVTE